MGSMDKDKGKAEEKAPSADALVYDDVPDPDEEDLDDLDQFLGDFSNTKIDAKSPAEPSGPGRPPAEPAAAKPSEAVPPIEDDEEVNEDELAKQFEASMAEMLGQLESSPEMKAQLEDLFSKIGEAAAEVESDAGAGGQPSFPSSSVNPTDASFPSTIDETIKRLQNSGRQATAQAESSGSDPFNDDFWKMLGGEDGGDPSKLFEKVLEELTSKDILYDPMKELDQKFPKWIEDNKAVVPAAEMKKYEEQMTIAKEIVVRFEQPGYSDESVADREYIVERMHKMQAAGSPPPDLVGDMSSAQELFNMDPNESCNPQ